MFERVFFLFLRSTYLKINLENSLVNDVIASVIYNWVSKSDTGAKGPTHLGVLGEYTC